MSVLVLRLAGPLQSWGSSSRFTRRETESAPTKSGILGLIAAAQGRRRSDPIEDLLGLELAVRTEQRGQLLKDFHTAHQQITGKSMPLTDRFYRADAVYTAHVGGPESVLQGVAQAMADPKFPLYLGRRACIPTGRLVLGIFDGSVAESVRNLPWHPGYQARQAHRNQSEVRLTVQADESVFPGLPVSRSLMDSPLSFNPVRRRYQSRAVVEMDVVISTGSDELVPTATGHDPMSLLGEA